MGKPSEMAVPNISSEVVFLIVWYLVAAAATLLAFINLFTQVQFIVPCVWLTFIAWSSWHACQRQGGFRRWIVNIMGVFVPRHFMESISQDSGSAQIRLGYRLFGKTLLYFTVYLDRIEAINWGEGQGGPRDWSVFIYFHGDVPARNWGSLKCDRIGTSRGKKKAEAFGLAVVEFFCRAGATMVRGKNDCTFVLATPRVAERSWGI